MDEQELSLSLGQRRTLLIYLSGLFPLGIRLLVRNSPVCESKHCNANGRNRSHLLIAGHRDDVQDCREAAQVARFPSVANAAPRSQLIKPRWSRDYHVDRGCLLRSDPHQVEHEAGHYRLRFLNAYHPCRYSTAKQAMCSRARNSPRVLMGSASGPAR